MRFSSIVRCLFACLMLTQVGSLQAQAQKPDPYGLDNPRATVSRHLYYLNEGADQQKSAQALFGGDLSMEERIKLAVKLKQIYDAKGDRVKPELIPDEANYVDSISGKARYPIFPAKYPGLYVQKYGNQWLYSRESVQSIERIYKENIPNNSELLMKLVPVVGNKSFLGLQLWQYVGILLMIGFTWLVYLLLKWAFGFFLQKIYPRLFAQATSLRKELIAPVTRPLSWLMITLLLRNWLVPSLLLPIGLSEWTLLALQILTPIFGVMVVYRLVDILTEVFSSLAGKTETTMDDQLIPLVRTTARLIVAVFGLIFVLQSLDVNVTALLAGVSIGGLAIALAAQETVKNFLGSVSIFLDKPFQVGDFIDTGSITGVVTEVGVRSCRIRALDGAQITVPNGKLVDMNITNHGVRTYRRFATTLTITYGTPREMIQRFVDGVREIANNHPRSIEGSVTVQFHEMGSSSLNVFLAVNYDTVAHADWLAARQDTLMEIMKLAESLTVDFAFPSTSLYVESLPNEYQPPQLPSPTPPEAKG